MRLSTKVYVAVLILWALALVYLSAQTTVSVDFVGTCIDLEDGDISEFIVWTSDVSGELGIGASFSMDLTEGDHLITATCTDSQGVGASMSVAINVNANDPPTVTITLPAAGCVGDGCP